MRLALEHHYSPRIAVQIRERGHDVVAALEAGWQELDDEELLSVCADEGRALLTNDVADFAVIARRWMAEGRSHHGLVFTSDAGFPRTRDTIGDYVDALERFLGGSPDDFVDRIHWLARP